MSLAPLIKDYTIPKGKVYFAPDDVSGNQTSHERFLGDCSNFTYSVETEKIEHTSSTGGMGEVDDTTFIRVLRSSALTMDSLDDDNRALFTIGQVATISQTSDSVTDEAVSGALQGREYQLGQSMNVTGVRGISNVVVTSNSGATTYDVTDDYTVDAALGRIYIVEGGAISDDTDLEVDYDYASNARSQVSSNQSTSLVGTLRIIADNPKGANRDHFFPKAEMGPSGELPLVGEEYQTADFDVSIQSRGGSVASQVYIDGRAA